MPDKITSVSNPRIRRLVELRKKAKLRRETGLFVIEGGRLCSDTPEEFISEVYVTEEWMKNAPEKENGWLPEPSVYSRDGGSHGKSRGHSDTAGDPVCRQDAFLQF